MSALRRGMVAATALLAVAMSTPSWAQSPPPAAGLREVPPEPAPVSPAPPSSNPGLLDDLGKLFEKITIIPLKRPGEADGESPARAPGEAAGAAPADQRPPPGPDRPAPSSNVQGGGLKDAGDTLSRLTKPSTMISGRIVCPLAANGTPDCKLGADRLCQGKGYRDGKSLNTDSAETCSARVLIPGRQRKPGDCRTDTFVTSALCQ
ncbi:conserved hypothetical protein; putative signal peptide [Bradyrhizobium sp. ORS 278]|uniref:hypothetical protein n=1 Tax=Bradyrhizobium sp. (strain ORS 278) TaxID=114615 RepID=UPI0001508D05|nr:hypothetical protein [Bradyrhizobium sp. ORS 278]CAL80183.1 conserved hypothetical protein; putative signal peptide [Bradyrhizobium sp. ORS 278]